MKIALKIDVDTLRGTREGAPTLATICRRHRANATFLFSLGPDNTGKALRRMFRRGFLAKVRRTSVLQHYGLKTCLYGTLLPAPDIGLRCRDVLRGIGELGFETGVHTYDHVEWQDNVSRRDPEWVGAQMRAATERYIDIFGTRPRVHGAAGWQMTDAAFLAEHELGFAYASDTRGGSPFYPEIGSRAPVCLQLPTTLPTLDELIGRDDLSGTPVEELLRLTANSRRDHVYTLHAELEGQQLAPMFEALLEGWTRQGFECVSLGQLAATIDTRSVAHRQVRYGSLPGRSGSLALSTEESLQAETT